MIEYVSLYYICFLAVNVRQWLLRNIFLTSVTSRLPTVLTSRMTQANHQQIGDPRRPADPCVVPRQNWSHEGQMVIERDGYWITGQNTVITRDSPLCSAVVFHIDLYQTRDDHKWVILERRLLICRVKMQLYRIRVRINYF